MKKWLIYISVLFAIILINFIVISATGASFLLTTDTETEYKEITVKEKYSNTRYDHLEKEPLIPFPLTKETLPNDLKWENGIDQPIFADPSAKKGGVYHSYIVSFPQTFRQIGPSSNSSFRSELDGNTLGLTDIHPVTGKLYPVLAKEWAIGKDKRTVYYKIDPDARWSDGVPVTADDFVYYIQLRRSAGIVDAWYNDYYAKQIEEVLKFDDYTIAIRLPRPKPNIVSNTSFSAAPFHFYGNMIKVKSKFKGEVAYYKYKNYHHTIPRELKYFDYKAELKRIQRDFKELAKTSSKVAISNNKIEELNANLSKFISKICKDQNKDLTGIKLTKSHLSQPYESVFKPISDLISSCKPSKEELDIEHELEVYDVVKDWPNKFNWLACPNTGPYRISSFMVGKWLVMKRSKNWWADKKKFFKHRYNPDAKRITVISKPEIAIEYFLQHKLDQFNLAQASFWYKKAPHSKPVKNGYVERHILFNNVPRPSRLLSMNMDKAGLDNKDVRIGLAHSINIQKIIDIVKLGDAAQAQTITTGYTGYTNSNIKPRKFDTKLASEYFAKAGYTKFDSDGFLTKGDKRLSFEMHHFTRDKEAVLIVKEEARKAGVEIVLKTFDDNTIFTAMLNKEHTLVWHAWAAGNYLSGSQYYGQFHNSNAHKKQNNNFSNVDDDKLSELIVQYRESTSSEERKKLAKEVQQIVHDECYCLPTFYVPFSRLASWNWVKIPAIVETPNCYTLFSNGLFWIDQEQKAKTLAASKSGKKMAPRTTIYDKYSSQKATN